MSRILRRPRIGGAIAIALAALAGVNAPDAARAQATAPEAALPAFATAEPVTALGILHWQQIQATRIGLGACLAAGGAATEQNRARAEAARSRFEATHAELRAHYAAFVGDARIAKQGERSIEDINGQWWRYGAALDAALTGRDISGEAMAGIHAVNLGLGGAVEKLHAGARRALTRAGKADLGQTAAEFAAFSHVWKAETAALMACLASLGTLPEVFAAEAATALAGFEAELAQAEASPFAPPAQKALIPAWRETLARLAEAAGGKPLAPAEADATLRILDDWAAASDRLGIEPKGGL
ncbi:hypothetical protein M1105_10930 [Limibaculum sp. FT325]|uniref:hypothetical protein n=1 Tax=Thermohalobaculum sediminis TaxID=2939436 RepID=UPI0020C126E7|nr:hypothetical protein [Limibaculum sediminis]MCL5777497.1 hypothetical protein [Limibaculum sediminis]